MRNRLAKCVLAVVVALLAVSTSFGQDSNRTDKTEFSVSFTNLGGITETSGGVTVKEEDWTMYGLNFGMNVNENLNVNFDLQYGNVEATGTGFGATAVADQDMVILMLNVDYNILTTPLTPVITGGIGFGYGFTEATASYGGTTATASAYSSSFLYTLGAGGRWDVNDQIFAKVLYRTLMDGSDSRDGFVAYLGFMFE